MYRFFFSINIPFYSISIQQYAKLIYIFIAFIIPYPIECIKYFALYFSHIEIYYCILIFICTISYRYIVSCKTNVFVELVLQKMKVLLWQNNPLSKTHCLYANQALKICTLTIYFNHFIYALTYASFSFNHLYIKIEVFCFFV